MHPPYLRDKARTLRAERRLTIDEIAERLALSRTTIFHWVRDLPIERPTRQSDAQRRGTAAMVAGSKARRDAAYALGVEEWPLLREDRLVRDFACLYLAEGFKRNRNRVAIGNSDAGVLRLAERALARFTAHPRRYSIQYHADQDVDELREWWAAELSIEPVAIRCQPEPNSGGLAGRPWRSAHGVRAVAVGETLQPARLGGWMDGLRREWV